MSIRNAMSATAAVNVLIVCALIVTEAFSDTMTDDANRNCAAYTLAVLIR